jgi:membrane-bound serine protease (ClpP class)
MIDGERYDVVSDGGYMDPNKPIKVIKVEGTRVVVREICGEPQD